MADPGYSTTPLLHKPGIRPDMKLLLINPQVNYFALLKKDVNGLLFKKQELPVLVHLFVKNHREFETGMKKHIATKNRSLITRVSRYKKTSRTPIDQT